MNPVCCSRMERGKACPDTVRARQRGERECPSRECPVGTRVPSRDTSADRPVVAVKPL